MARRDLSQTSQEETKALPKYKLLYPTPGSQFLNIKCGVCDTSNVCFSHSQTLRTCVSCGDILLKPAGGRASINEDCAVRDIKEYEHK